MGLLFASGLHAARQLVAAAAGWRQRDRVRIRDPWRRTAPPNGVRPPPGQSPRPSGPSRADG